MRLLFVNSAWPQAWGGGEKWTVEAADWFRAHGNEVSVVGRPQSRLLAAARELDLPSIEFRFGGDFDPLAVLGARRLLREFKADLVIVNFNKEAWQFGLAARKFEIPVIARHGFPLFRKSLHHRKLADSVLAGLVVNARSIRERYAALGFDVSQVEVIHNGVKLPAQRKEDLRRRYGLGDGTPLILAAGRIESQKRFDRMIEIAARLVRSFPNLRVLIAGEGPDRETLEQDVRTRGLSDQVLFTGFISDLASVIGDVDLLLLTSDEEGTPNVLLEAMAAKVACVAFNVGAVPDIFSGELSPNGISPGDISAMTERVRALLHDPAVRKSTGEQMAGRIDSEFTLDRSMSRYAELFERTLRVMA